MSKTIQVIVDNDQRRLVREFAFELDTSLSTAARTLIEHGLSHRKAHPNARLKPVPLVPSELAPSELVEYLTLRWDIPPTVAQEVIDFFVCNSVTKPSGVFEVQPNTMSDFEMLKPILAAHVHQPKPEAAVNDDDFQVIE